MKRRNRVFALYFSCENLMYMSTENSVKRSLKIRSPLTGLNTCSISAIGAVIAERDKYNANEVKSGLTGWAQINGGDELEIPDKAKLAGEYVERISFPFDVKCFIGTIFSVAKSKGGEGGTGGMKKRGEKKMRIEKVQEFVSTFSPLYFEDCYGGDRKDVEKEYKIKINHSVKRKDEDDILKFLKNAEQDIKTIKWKLGVDINCS